MYLKLKIKIVYKSCLLRFVELMCKDILKECSDKYLKKASPFFELLKSVMHLSPHIITFMIHLQTF